MPVSPPATRRAKVVLALLIATASALAGAACAGDGPTGPPDSPIVASVLVTPGGDTLIALGRTRTFTAVAREADGTPIPGAMIRWRSSNTAVALVDSMTGVVTAFGNGTSTITAFSGGITGTGTVSVIQFVATVTVTPGTSGLSALGATQVYTAVARDSANAIVAGVRFLWGSSQQSVATIDTNGVAHAVGAGATTISATGRGVPAYAALTVTQNPTQLAFSVDAAVVRAGQVFPLAIQVEVRDSSGALVTGSRIPITLEVAFGAANKSVGGSRTVNAVGGIATFGGVWVGGVTGSYSLRATAAGVAPDTSGLYQLLPGLPASMDVQFTNGTSFVAGVGTSGGVRVSFLDAYGNASDTTRAVVLSLHGPIGVNTIFRPSAPVLGAGPTVVFQNVAIDRPGGPYTIEARTGDALIPIVATTAPFIVRGDFTQLALDQATSCARSAGGVFCWGRNTSGELSSPSAGNAPRDSIASRADRGPYTQVDVTDNSVCGLTATGAVECWGQGGSYTIAGTGSGALAFTQFSMGVDFSCGLNAAGAVYCWGSGELGQLGNGAFTTSGIPVHVRGTGNADTVVTAIDAGDNYACGIVASNRRGYCWGENDHGQLGNNVAGNSGVPARVFNTGLGGTELARIDASRAETTCAIDINGVAACWGWGPLGNGTGNSSPIPIGLNLPGFIIDVTSGEDHTCALDDVGRVYCWGYNLQGQVGPSSTLNLQLAPVPVDVSGRTVVDIEAGVGTTCARTTTAGIYCWGSNTDARLGIGRTDPARVVFPTRIIQ